jgi:hypothetical protein
VVARGLGKPCVASAQELEVNEEQHRFSVNGRSIKQGEWITIDGGTGRVYAGKAELKRPELSGDFTRLMQWADKVRHIRVRVNADTPADAHRGRDFGAEGIGLCRTEHMFFEGDRLLAMREMILAQDPEGRKKALAKLLPMQRGDFEAIFRAMEGFPVTIRLLDPPLHEFLPREAAEVEALASSLGKSAAEVQRFVNGLQETNPMLGLRGCRLGIVYPEITAMQARAIFEAACAVAFRSTGQSCSLGSRLFVQRPIYESFLDRIAARARRIRVGMPLDRATHIGPQTSAEQLAKTERYIAIGKEEGARLVSGGKRPQGFTRGYFVEPTVFADVDNRSRLAQEEIFGPVLAVMPFDTEEEAVRLANDVEYGLVAGLWTSDVGRAHRVAAAIEAGLVTVNTFRTTHPMLPYGGYKLSGLGRENGMEALHHFTEVKTVVVDFDTTPPADPFAD